MFITGFPAGAWQTNCFVIASTTGEDALIVDPGQDSIGRIREELERHRLRPVAVLLTHGHMDHIWSVAPLTAGRGIPAYIHADDRYRLEDPIGSTFAAAREQLLAMTKGELEMTAPEEIKEFGDGDVLDLVGVPLRISHTPGHTEGSVTFLAPRAGERPPVFISGDTLFAGSIGRTDLPGGDPVAMTESLRRVVLPLDDDTVVMPGHGPMSTIGEERATNPYLRDLGLAAPTRGV